MASQALLDLGGADLRDKRALSVISEPLLAALMVEATSADDAGRVLGRDPVLLSEARRVLPLVNRNAAGVGHDGVYIRLQPLVILFEAPDFGPGDAGDALFESWTTIYAKALSRLPAEALEHAVSEWIRVGRPFFPKPSELTKLAEPIHLKIANIAYRLKRAVELADAAHGQTQIDPEERARVKAQFAELRQALGAKANPMAAPSRLGRDPHQVAEELRRAAG